MEAAAKGQEKLAAVTRGLQAAQEETARLAALNATLQAELDEAHAARQKETLAREAAVTQLQDQLTGLKA